LQVFAVELVKPRVGQAQLGRRSLSGELTAAMGGRDVTDEGSGQTFDHLFFSSPPRMRENEDLSV
jgi:hypothetical protein